MDEHKTPETPQEDKNKEEVAQNTKRQAEKNPFGENVKPAMYILFDEVKGNFFILGAPGFMDDPVRAYGALKMAEKNLDDFYKQKKSFRDMLSNGVRRFHNRMNFKRFINGR